jgi:hypothetical protein
MFIVLSSVILSCKHRPTYEEMQYIAELTIKHRLDPSNKKNLSDFQFREFQKNSDGSGYSIVLSNDYMSEAELWKHFSPQTLIFLNADCTRITSLATE